MKKNTYTKQLLDQEINNGLLSSYYVYKYLSIESALKVLENSTLKFSSPHNFNDPFDCKVNINIDGGYQEIYNYLCRANKNRDISISQLKNIATELATNPIAKYRYLVETIEQAINEMKICCFSEVYDSILMWTHYANNHTGICFKFDISKDLACFSLPLKVKYAKEFHEFNLFNEYSSGITNMPRYKSEEWAYEREIRMIKALGCESFNSFNRDSLIEVIFGLRTKQENIDSIKRIIEKIGYKKIIYKKIEIINNKFALKTRGIE